MPRSREIRSRPKSSSARQPAPRGTALPLAPRATSARTESARVGPSRASSTPCHRHDQRLPPALNHSPPGGPQQRKFRPRPRGDRARQLVQKCVPRLADPEPPGPPTAGDARPLSAVAGAGTEAPPPGSRNEGGRDPQLAGSIQTGRPWSLTYCSSARRRNGSNGRTSQRETARMPPSPAGPLPASSRMSTVST